MKIFGKQRDSLRIKKVKAARAMFMDGNGTEEIEVKVMTDEGHILVLQIPQKLVPGLIFNLRDAYQAINPPLAWGSNFQAQWDGSDNQ